MIRSHHFGPIAALILLSLGSQLFAQGSAPLRTIRWDELARDNRLQAGEVLEADGEHDGVLKIEHAGPGPASFELVEITEPGITGLNYAVTGELRYEDVSGTGYLEMLNFLPGEQWFFSRTLANAGPLASISGTSDWREFQLPAMLGDDPAVARPERLVINLHLEGPGTVYLSDLELSHISPQAIGTPSGAWWGDRAGGLVGGIAGSLLGLIGAVVGVLAGMGRGRPIVMGLLLLMVAFGSVSLVAGVVALAMSQPYAVAYPLLLLGVLSAGLGGAMFPVMKQRYHAAELRRMQALDAG